MARKELVVLALLLVVSVLVISGCVREPEVCNYDRICTAEETDNCVDCANVLDRNGDAQAADSPESSP